MTHPDVPAAGRGQPEVTEPDLPPQAGVPCQAAGADPGNGLPVPVFRGVAVLKPAAGAAAGEPTAAARAGQDRDPEESPDDDRRRQASGPPPVTAASLAASLAARLPAAGIAEAIWPATGADSGLGQAASKMFLPDAVLFRVHQQAVSSLAAAWVPSVSTAAEALWPAALADAGLGQAVSKMIAAPDLGLLTVHQQAARNAAAVLTRHHDLLRAADGVIPASLAALVPPVNLTAMSATAGLADLLVRWRETAEYGTGILRSLARAAFRAALRARAAVLHGDDGPVARFIQAWLGLRPTAKRVEAVSAALLEEGWDTAIPDDPSNLLADLRKRTHRQARALRPLWENQLNRRRVILLDQPFLTRTGTVMTVADLVPGGQDAEDLALAGEREEQRLSRVLGRLGPEELRVTSVYAQRSGLTWTEAARAAGAADPAAAGERVRRKLKRLAAEDRRRLSLRSGGR